MIPITAIKAAPFGAAFSLASPLAQYRIGRSAQFR
jgi:hypothetical protein